jgi:flagellar hook-basal body complex protein FliE
MAVPALGGTAAALQAYRATAAQGGTSAGSDFGSMLTGALQGVIGDGHAAETLSTQAITGKGDVLDVVSAISRAELSLQTTIAVRDKVVQAYQDIMRMAI